MSITLRELEILAALRQRWTRLYFNELKRLLRELDGPYLFRPRARSRRRLRAPAVLRWQSRRRLKPRARQEATNWNGWDISTF